MSKKIASYDDLLTEKARLQELLGLQKTAVKANFSAVRESVQPVTNGLLVVTRVLGRIGKRRQRPGAPLLNAGIDLGVDMVLRRYLLRKSGWFVRTVVPLLAGTLLTRFVNSEKESKLSKKVRSMLARFGVPAGDPKGAGG